MPGESGEVGLVNGYHGRPDVASHPGRGRTENGWRRKVNDVGRELTQNPADPPRGNGQRQVSVYRERYRRDPLDRRPSSERGPRPGSENQSFVTVGFQMIENPEY